MEKACRLLDDSKLGIRGVRETAQGQMLQALLAGGVTLNTIRHYETHLTRLLHRELRELQRFQAARHNDTIPAPIAVDVYAVINKPQRDGKTDVHLELGALSSGSAQLTMLTIPSSVFNACPSSRLLAKTNVLLFSANPSLTSLAAAARSSARNSRVWAYGSNSLTDSS